MKYLIVLVVVLAAFACTSEANKQICTAQYECSANQYCRSGYCVDCLSHCDCGLDEYCSSNSVDLNKFGTCQKFDLNGKKCINLQDLTDERVDNSTKCAMMYYNPLANAGGRMVSDYTGTCIGGKCRMCNYVGGSPCSTGTGKPKTCVFPGKYATPHSANWSPGLYYQDPVRVWLAIFFCFIFVITVFHILGYLFHK